MFRTAGFAGAVEFVQKTSGNRRLQDGIVWRLTSQPTNKQQQGSGSTMQKKSLALLVFFVLLHSGAAQATAMQESPRTGMSLSFDNGDSLEVACRRYGEFCKLKLRINGKRFLFESKDLGGLEIIPERASLYSGEASGREKYFSFEISVVCPEVNGKMPPYDCVAGVLVQENEAPVVTLRRRATRYVENP